MGRYEKRAPLKRLRGRLRESSPFGGYERSHVIPNAKGHVSAWGASSRGSFARHNWRACSLASMFVVMVPLFFNYVIIERGSRRTCVTPSP